jgi:hypothetical protein
LHLGGHGKLRGGASARGERPWKGDEDVADDAGRTTLWLQRTAAECCTRPMPLEAVARCAVERVLAASSPSLLVEGAPATWSVDGVLVFPLVAGGRNRAESLSSPFLRVEGALAAVFLSPGEGEAAACSAGPQERAAPAAWASALRPSEGTVELVGSPSAQSPTTKLPESSTGAAAARSLRTPSRRPWRRRTWWCMGLGIATPLYRVRNRLGESIRFNLFDERGLTGKIVFGMESDSDSSVYIKALSFSHSPPISVTRRIIPPSDDMQFLRFLVRNATPSTPAAAVVSPSSPPPPSPDREDKLVVKAGGGSVPPEVLDDDSGFVDVELVGEQQKEGSPSTPEKPTRGHRTLWFLFLTSGDDTTRNLDEADVELEEQQPKPGSTSSTLMKPTAGQRSSRRWCRVLLVVAGWLSVVALLAAAGYLFWLIFKIVTGLLDIVRPFLHHH